MRITKLGHSCLLLEEYTVKILIDPGIYSSVPKHIEGLDFILITHEHSDHFDIEAVKQLMQQNKDTQIITNRGVSLLLEEETLPYFILEAGKTLERRGIKIQAVGNQHAEIYPILTPVENTGFLISDEFFYPGDSFTPPEQEINILALPVSAPWLKLSEAIDYAKFVKPKLCFPVHDGMLKVLGPVHKIPAIAFEASNIRWRVLETGQEIEA